MVEISSGTDFLHIDIKVLQWKAQERGVVAGGSETTELVKDWRAFSGTRNTPRVGAILN